MKGLKIMSLALAASTAGVCHAELVAMDDSALANTVGQAGITVEVNESLITMGSIDYKDQGFLSIKDIRLMGADLVSPMDNIKLTLDVAGAGGLDLGTPNLGSQAIIAGGGSVTNLVEVDQNAKISDGDLIISLRALDDTQPLDYGMYIGSIELGASTNTEGSVNGGTVIVSDWSVSGNIGAIDLVFDNGGDGFNLSVFFNAQGDITLPFIAASASFNMHNSRGSSQVSQGTDSFAHVQLNVSQGTTATGATAVAFDLQDLSGDIDITNIQLGDNGQSIGDLYLTDLHIGAQTLIYGH